MTSAERAKLRGIAMQTEILSTVGKNGVSENLVKQLDEQLTARELVKVKVLPSCESDAKQLVDELATSCGAEAVQVIGKIITLYRYSAKRDIKHLL